MYDVAIKFDMCFSEFINLYDKFRFTIKRIVLIEKACECGCGCEVYNKRSFKICKEFYYGSDGVYVQYVDNRSKNCKLILFEKYLTKKTK